MITSITLSPWFTFHPGNTSIYFWRNSLVIPVGFKRFLFTARKLPYNGFLFIRQNINGKSLVFHASAGFCFELILKQAGDPRKPRKKNSQ
jgi:hypothetical protein